MGSSELDRRVSQGLLTRQPRGGSSPDRFFSRRAARALAILGFASALLVTLPRAQARAAEALETEAASHPPTFEASVSELSPAQKKAMTPSVWRPGCPVPLEALVRIELSYWDLEGRVRRGVLVVHREVAEPTVRAFRGLFAARFPIARMVPMERYDGDDDRAMADNDTSAFNCRPVKGSRRFSEHAFGRAIDLNPLFNPWVRGETVEPPGARAYRDRDPSIPGLIVEGGPALRAFEAAGWRWGGRWRRSKDYQHFSRNGR